jgi:hypothetical protein
MHNQLQYGWGFAAAQLLRGRREYKIGGFYVEYANVALPEDVIQEPAFDRSEGIEYYNDLSGSRDYLRIPLLGEPELLIAEGYEDHFTEGVDGNQLDMVGQTSGSTGVHGLPFSDSVNSKVYGVALVAIPDSGDRSRDVIIARGYYAAAHQVLKTASAQITVSWSQKFI